MAVKARKPLVAGNWKMNGLQASSQKMRVLIRSLGAKSFTCGVLVCPPATLIQPLHKGFARRIALGGQDCHPDVSGAHTGDISAEMLADAGASAVIVGHSERRADHAETSEIVAAKAAAGHRAKLMVIICVGETQAERDGGKTLDVISKQLRHSLPSSATAANTVIAYEPVWAIGTGRTPSAADIAQVHAFIRDDLSPIIGAGEAEKMRILYGGSVKPENAGQILNIANVDGALVGGASLNPADFLAIIGVYARKPRKAAKTTMRPSKAGTKTRAKTRAKIGAKTGTRKGLKRA